MDGSKLKCFSQGAMTLSKIVLSISTFSIRILSIKGLFVTLSVNDTQFIMH